MADVIDLEQAREPWDQEAFRRQILELVAQIMQMPMGAEFICRALEDHAYHLLRCVRDEPEYAEIVAIARVVLPNWQEPEDGDWPGAV
jgi:hypothetical protein